MHVGSLGLKDAISLQAAAQEQGMCAGQGKCQLGVSVFVFVTSLSGAQGTLMLRSSALSSPGSLSWFPACPGIDVVPAQQWFHGNGDAKRVSHKHHSCMKHTHLLA